MRLWLALCVVASPALSAAVALAQPVPAPFTVMPPLESFRTGPQARLVPVTIVLTGEVAARGRLRVLQLVPSGRRWPAWRFEGQADVPAGRANVTLHGTPGERTLLVVLDERPGYVLDGPFGWPGRQDVRTIDTRWRRTLLGALPVLAVTPSFVWVSGARLPEAGPWPACGVLTEVRWECIGVPWDEAGVLILSTGPPVRFAVAGVAGREPGTDRSISGPAPVGQATWCRLLRVVSAASPWSPLATVTVEPMRRRARKVGRLALEPDGRVTVDSLGPDAFWVCGSAEPDDGVLHVEGPSVATTDVAFDGWQHGPPELSHELMLDPPVRVAGRVEDAEREPVADTLVVVSRVVVSDPPSDPADAPRPEYVAEVLSRKDGTFEVPGLREGRYEFAGLHPTRGRVTEVVDLDGSPVVLRLVPSRRVRGRVLRDREPIAGVPVGLAPDLAAYMSGADPLDLAAFGGQTDDAGRFDVAVPPAGAGVLRVGTVESGIVRVPLGPADQLPAVTDVGDIELPSPVRLVVEVDGPRGCDLTAVGPFGSAGMTVVQGVAGSDGRYLFQVPEAGRWILDLSCASTDVPVLPPFVDVPAGEREAFARVVARIGG